MIIDNARKPLKSDTVLNNKYIIDDYIASGGSCLVYSAHYIDEAGARHNVILKECYPYNDEIVVERNDNGELEWYEGDREYSIERAVKAATNLNAFENNAKMAGNASVSTDNFYANNTFYNVAAANMSGNAAVYSRYEKDEKIKDILKTMSALTGVIGKLHEDRKLHLDIKPDNFMVDMLTEADHQKRIILFDVDSLIEVNEKGKIEKPQIITFSRGYCAPEMWDDDLSSIGFESDIFSLGAVLFEKIFGRVPSNMDAWPAARYDFSKSKVFADENSKDINPAVKTKVHEILKTTLAPLPSFRYPTASDLKKELDAAIKLCESPFLESNVSPADTYFFGRENELDRISEELKDNDILIIEAEGGMGKTSLVHKWINDHENDFHTKIYLDFKNGVDQNAGTTLLDLLKNSGIKIGNYDEKDDDKRAEKILELLKNESVVLLVDNFDIPGNGQSTGLSDVFEALQGISSTGIKIIITSRNRLEDYYGKSDLKGKIIEMQLGAFDADNAKLMFEKFAEKSCGEKEFETLYGTVGGNTLALTLIAGLYKNGNSLEKLIGGFKNEFGLTIRKKGTRISLDEIFDSLYETACLTEAQKRALQYIYLFRRTDFNKTILQKIRSFDFDINDDLLEDMVLLGWIEHAGESWFLHEVIKRIVRSKLDPCLEREPFDKLKQWEFYMYFSVDVFGTDGTKYRLSSHFEKDDFLESLVIPEDVPELSIFGLSPFYRLTFAQRGGHLGCAVSVDEGNPFYQSKNNCIYSKTRKADAVFPASVFVKKTLLFMSIDDSSIPDDEDISVIGPMSCLYNRNKRINIPATVESVGFNAFGHISDATKIVFRSVPYVSPFAFECSNAAVEFENKDIANIGGWYIDRSDWSVMFRQGERKDVLEIPFCVKKIKKPLERSRAVILNEGIEEIAPGTIRCEVIMDRSGKRHMVVGNSLIRKNDDSTGTVTVSWGELPTSEWIITLGEKCMVRSCEELVIPDNFRRIEKHAFYHTVGKTIRLPRSISYIGGYAFVNSYFEKVRYDGTFEQWKAIEKDRYWLSGHHSIHIFEFSDAEYTFDEMFEMCRPVKLIKPVKE